MGPARRPAAWALIALPCAATTYLGFNSGGFFPLATGIVAALLAVLLALRVVTTETPLPRISWPLVGVAAAMTLLTVWTLVSNGWSHAPGRALIEFDRALLYLFALLAAAAFAATSDGLRWLLRSVALGCFLVSGAGLVSRVLPRVWPIRQTLHPERLSYPVSYWNALGLLAMLGLLLCFYMATSERESRVARVLAAAACPLFASTALFTYSRGALGVGAVVLLVYVALARPRGLLAGVLATVPASAVALVVTYDADKLSSDAPASAAAVSQGHGVALALVLCSLAAAALRWLMLGLDERLAGMPVRRVPRRSLALAATVGIAVVVAVSLSLDVPSSIGSQYNHFLRGGDPQHAGAPIRSRLTDPSNDGRFPLWHVVLRGFHASPVHGSGAGTFETMWYRYRPNNDAVTEAHSLYVEALGELGVVGLVLVVLVVAGALVGIAVRIRGPDRALYAALFAVVLMWAVVAGFDWDWDTTAVTASFMALAGGALAYSRRAVHIGSTTLRVAIAIGLLVLAITPAQVALSQARLDDSISAFKRGDYGSAISDALSSNSLVGSRAEPFEVLGFADARLGRYDLAQLAMSNAITRDRANWELHYGMALIQAAGGHDPRAEARLAYRLNPRERLTADALDNFRAANRAHWRAAALRSQLPIT